MPEHLTPSRSESAQFVAISVPTLRPLHCVRCEMPRPTLLAQYLQQRARELRRIGDDVVVDYRHERRGGIGLPATIMPASCVAMNWLVSPSMPTPGRAWRNAVSR